MPTFADALESAIRKAAREEVADALKDLRRTLARLERAVAKGQAVPAGGRKAGRRGGGAGRGAAAPSEPSIAPAEVKALRKRLGLTQKDMARKLGVTHVAVYFWESGRTNARGKNLAKLRQLQKDAGGRRRG